LIQGEGTELLLQAISERLTDDIFHETMDLSPRDGQLRAQLYAQGAVMKEQVDDQGGMHLEVRMQRKDLLQLLTRLGLPTEPYRIKEEFY
jgi:GTP-binding protein HflX